METIKASELVHRVVDRTYEELITLQRELPQETPALRQQKLYKFLTVVHVRLAKTLAVVRAAAPLGPHAEIALKVAAARRLEFAAQQMQEFSMALGAQIPLTPRAALPSQDAESAVSLVARAPLWAAITHPKSGPGAARKLLRPVPFQGLPPKLYSYASLAQLPGSWLNVAWQSPPPAFASKLLQAVMPHLTVPPMTSIKAHPTQPSKAVFAREGHYSIEMQPVLLSAGTGIAAGVGAGPPAPRLAVGWQVRSISLASDHKGDYALTNLEAGHTQRVAIVLSVLSQHVPASQQLAAVDAFLRRLLGTLALDSAAAAAVQMTQAAAAAGRLHASSSPAQAAARSQALLPTHRRMALHFAAGALGSPAQVAQLAQQLTSDHQDKAAAVSSFLQGAMSSTGGQHSHEVALAAVATRLLLLRSAHTVLFALDSSPIRHVEEAAPLPPPLSSPAAGQAVGRRHGRALVSDVHATLEQANAEGVSAATRSSMLHSVMDTLAAGALCVDALRVTPKPGGGSTVEGGPPSATPLKDAAVGAAAGVLPPCFMACTISSSEPNLVHWCVWVPAASGALRPVSVSFPQTSAPSVAHMAGVAAAMNTMAARNMLASAAEPQGAPSAPHSWQVGWQLPGVLSAPAAPPLPPVLHPALKELQAQMQAAAASGAQDGTSAPARVVQLQLPYALLPAASLRSVQQWLPQLRLLRPAGASPEPNTALLHIVHNWLVDLAQHAHSALLSALSQWGSWSRGQLLGAMKHRWHAQLLAPEPAQHFGALLPGSPWGQLDTRDSPFFRSMEGCAGGTSPLDAAAAELALCSVLPAAAEETDGAVAASVAAAVRVRALLQGQLCGGGGAVPPRHTAAGRTLLLAARNGVAAAAEGLAWMKHLQSGVALPSAVSSERFGARAAQHACRQLSGLGGGSGGQDRQPSAMHAATQLGRMMSAADSVFHASFSHYCAVILGDVLWRLAAGEAARRGIAHALRMHARVPPLVPGQPGPVHISIGSAAHVAFSSSCAVSALPGLSHGAALRLLAAPQPPVMQPLQGGSYHGTLTVQLPCTAAWSTVQGPLYDFGLVDLGGHWHTMPQAEERPPPATLTMLLQGPLPQLDVDTTNEATEQDGTAPGASPGAAAGGSGATSSKDAAKPQDAESTEPKPRPYSADNPEQNDLMRHFWRGVGSAGSWQSLAPCMDVSGGVPLPQGGVDVPASAAVQAAVPTADSTPLRAATRMLFSELVPSLAAAVAAAAGSAQSNTPPVPPPAAVEDAAHATGPTTDTVPQVDGGASDARDGRTPALCCEAGRGASAAVARAVARLVAQQCSVSEATAAITAALQPVVQATQGSLRDAQAAVASDRLVSPATVSPRALAAAAAMQPQVLLSVQLPADLLLTDVQKRPAEPTLGHVFAPPSLRLDVARVLGAAAGQAGLAGLYLAVQGGSAAALAALKQAIPPIGTAGVHLHNLSVWADGQSGQSGQEALTPVYIAHPQMAEYVTGSISAAAQQAAAVLAFVPQWALLEAARERHSLFCTWQRISGLAYQRLMQWWAKKNPGKSGSALPPMPESASKLVPARPEGALEEPPTPPPAPAAWTEVSLPAERPYPIGLLHHDQRQYMGTFVENTGVYCISARSVVPSAAAALLMVPRVLLPTQAAAAPMRVQPAALQLQAPVWEQEVQALGGAVTRFGSWQVQAAALHQHLHSKAWAAVLQAALAICGWDAFMDNGLIHVRGATRGAASLGWAGQCVPRHLAGQGQLPGLTYVDTLLELCADNTGTMSAKLHGRELAAALDAADVPGTVQRVVALLCQ